MIKAGGRSISARSVPKSRGFPPRPALDACSEYPSRSCADGVVRVQGCMEIVERDPGPLARFEEVKADPSVPSMVFGKLTAEEPETLPQIAKAWRVPRGRFVEWFVTQHAQLYDAALLVLTEQLAREALEKADGATPEDVSVRKLQVDTRLRLASKWDRKRYGEEHERMVVAPVTIQIGGFRSWKKVEEVTQEEREVIAEVLPSVPVEDI